MKGISMKLGALMLLAGGALIGSLGIYRAKAAEPTGAKQQLCIRIRCWEGDPKGSRKDGTLKLLSEPQLITEDGHACSMMAGGERAVDPGSGPVELIEYGTKVQLTPTLGKGKDKGKVRLDACLDITTLEEEPGGRVHLTRRGDRHLGWYRLGEVVKLSLRGAPSGKQTWAELVVEEAR